MFFDYDAGQILKEHEYLKDIVPAGPIYISEEVCLHVEWISYDSDIETGILHSDP